MPIGALVVIFELKSRPLPYVKDNEPALTTPMDVALIE
jgi:hypothetical protein